MFGVIMPECDSDPDSLRLGHELARALGIATVVEDIAPMLEAAGCYRRRDEIIRELVPDYGEGWGCKLVLANAMQGHGFTLTSLVVRSPDGEMKKLRLSIDQYRGIVAAANMKQRMRKQIEYYHADRLGYAVAGTPNRLEYEQGFFVKNGDGAADIKPIAHLYKSQVYQLAEHLGLPDEIRSRPPTTDTWSLPQTQEEFYFSLPWRQLDLCMLSLDKGVPATEVAAAAGLTADQVEHAWREIESRRRASLYQHEAPLLVEPVKTTS
jgi:NAD+ synthase